MLRICIPEIIILEHVRNSTSERIDGRLNLGGRCCISILVADEVVFYVVAAAAVFVPVVAAVAAPQGG